MIQTTVFIVAGLALLAIGGDVLVRGSMRAASALGVSKLLVGLVVVGFGTSSPELATSLMAAFRESPGLVVGNVIGSNIANILLILGFAACVTPLTVRRGVFARDTVAMIVAALAATAVVLAGVAGHVAGAALTALLIAYLVIAVRGERRSTAMQAPLANTMAASVATSSPRDTREIAIALGLAVAGIAATVAGAHLLVVGAIDVATRSGIPEAVIGLTIVAVGTSLPELVACTVAAMHRQSEVAIGNVLGSCIYNVFGVLGFTALVHPLPVPASIASLDLLALLGSAVLLGAFLLRGKTLGRLGGCGFILLYASYLGSLVGHD